MLKKGAEFRVDRDAWIKRYGFDSACFIPTDTVLRLSSGVDDEEPFLLMDNFGYFHKSVLKPLSEEIVI
jgi:hypothetical protein